MRRRIIPFIVVISIFLYIANLAVYEAAALAFNIVSPSALLCLGIVLGVMSASFVLSTIAGMQWYNVFTRTIYRISAIWIGFFAYLFLVSAVYGLLVAATGNPLPIVGMIGFGIALVLSFYGVINARTLVVTKVDVALPQLPPSWRGKKAVWVSDLHLGQINGPAFAKRVVDRINALTPDIVFIGGDLYDGTSAPDPTMLAAPLSKLSSTFGTYYISGNHEEFGAGDTFFKAVRSLSITTLIDQVVEIDGMQVIGVDYKSTESPEGFREVLSRLLTDTHKPSILLKHEPRHSEIARDHTVSLQISGHTHRGQQWPFMYVSQLVYKQFAYGLSRSGDFQAYTSSGVGTWGPPLRVGTRAEIVLFTFI
jgi:predicted MPP superfamily phosphohydrolase